MCVCVWLYPCCHCTAQAEAPCIAASQSIADAGVDRVPSIADAGMDRVPGIADARMVRVPWKLQATGVCVWVEGDVLACLYGGMLRPLLRLRTLAVILGWRSFDGIKTVLMPVYTS